MPQQQSPFLEGKYGWNFGESGWNTGMDENLLKFSYMFDRNVDGIVSSLPAAVNGQAYFLTTDNRLYFAVGNTWYSSPVPKWFEFKIRSTGDVYQFNGTSVTQIESPADLDARLDAIELTVSTLGSAAFEDVSAFATTEELDIVEGQAQTYTDTLRSDLADSTDPAKGAGMVGYKGRTQHDVNSDVVNIADFGALPSLGDIGPAFQAALLEAAASGKELVIPAGHYNMSTPVSLTAEQSVNNRGVSIRGLGNLRGVKITYTGPGRALSFIGDGLEGGTPITRFSIKNLHIDGAANTVSDGGFYFERCYIVRVEDCSSTSWSKAGACSLEARNTFNFECSGGNYSNGFPSATGGPVVRVGSMLPDAWNTSNVIFRNTLIQRGNIGIHVAQDANILDNLVFDNVSVGGNAEWGLYCDSPNVNNITVTNCHFEHNGGVAGGAGGHVFIKNSLGVNIQVSSFQDAMNHIILDGVRDFDIGRGCKFFETGTYDLTGATLIKLRSTEQQCRGTWGENFVRTDQIDNLWDIQEGAGGPIDIARRPRLRANEAGWSSLYSGSPLAYEGTPVDRYQSANAPFDRMIPFGGQWYRQVISSMYKGERTSAPSTTETAGSFYLNKNATVVGSGSTQYVMFGWITTGGGVWKEMRIPTGG